MESNYILPDELWVMIFNKVRHPEYKLNLMRAFPNLYNHFGGIEKEEQLLFPSTLTYVMAHLESSGRKLNSEERKAQRKVLLACRLVSSYSCVAIDEWLQEYWTQTRKRDHQPPSFLYAPEINYFSRSVLDKFLRDFQNDHCVTRNPLLGRFATLPDSTLYWYMAVREEIVWAQEQEYDKKTITVFKKIGPHLRQLEVIITIERFKLQESWLAKLNSLRNVLESSPNLKSLVFGFNGWTEVPRLGNNERFFLPPLPKLDYLKVRAGDAPQKCILASLQVYFQRLKQLDFEDVVDFPDDYLTEGLFPELRLLKMTANSDLFATEEKLAKIFKRISAPNLARVELRIKLLSDVTVQFEEMRKNGLLCLNKNSACSRPEPELQWEVTTVRDNVSENIMRATLIFSRNIN